MIETIRRLRTRAGSVGIGTLRGSDLEHGHQLHHLPRGAGRRHGRDLRAEGRDRARHHPSAETSVGHPRGGLAPVCVTATTPFAAISGASVVTAMALGTFPGPAMIGHGIDRPFVLGPVGASDPPGILIPPACR
jgi:hypothetical protein